MGGTCSARSKPDVAPSVNSVSSKSIAENDPVKDSEPEYDDQQGPLPDLAKRRAKVKAESIHVASSGSDIHNIYPISEKCDDDKLAIKAALKGNEFFESGVDQVVARMKALDAQVDEIVVEKGTFGDVFYVIGSGVYEVLLDDMENVFLKPGKAFGENALLYNSARNATVVCRESGVLWTIDRWTYRHIMADLNSKQINNTIEWLSSVKLLQDLHEDQKLRIAEAFKIEQYPADTLIIRQGEPGETFYLIMEGSVEITITKDKTTVHAGTLSTGEYFGERALLKQEPRAATVRATTPVTLMTLDRQAFNELLGPLKELLDFALGERVIKAIPLLKDLSEVERTELVENMEHKEFSPGEKIIQQGEIGDTFYIIKEGQVEVSSISQESQARITIGTLGRGDYFGEMALLDNTPRAADVIAVTTVHIAFLDKAKFETLLGPLKDVLEGQKGQRKRDLSRKTQVEAAHPMSSVRKDDLKVVATLGMGSFGRVMLVTDRSTKERYALKVLSKAHLVRYKQTKNVVNEKRVMCQCQHPFIMRLHQTFQDPDNIYMLLELVQGGELFSYLHSKRGGKIDSSAARFYFASVVLVFEYLQTKQILYRDLKPENLLIGADGYLKVADFGFSKVCRGRTYTLCGTLLYLAPEVILGRGYNKSFDCWTLGVLLYEMVCGLSPFQGPYGPDDQINICRSILRDSVKFPSRMKDHLAQDLIRRLLDKDPSKRLGCLRGGMSDVKNHPWFEGFDWDALYNKKLQPPWIPPIKGDYDTSHFSVNPGDVSSMSQPFKGDDSWAVEF